jgi:hypothetical protein
MPLIIRNAATIDRIEVRLEQFPAQFRGPSEELVP